MLGCGGTIARHVAEGDNVGVAIVTRGDDSYDQAWVEKCRLEAREVHLLLGVQTCFLDFPSPSLDSVLTAEIVDAFREFTGYDIVYIPHAGDLHQEHRQIHDACLVAFRPPGPDVYAYETLSSTEWGTGFVPDHFVEITATVETKVAAMRCYQSQIQEPPHPRSEDGIRSLAKVRGMTVGVDAAEAFVTVRTVR